MIDPGTSAEDRTLINTITPSAPTLDHLFVEAAIQCPGADALIGSFGSLSYADLLIRAQNIALVLRRRGIGPGSFVGVVAEASPVIVTAIVGIVLAGAAYVPLTERALQQEAHALLEQLGISIVLSDGVWALEDKAHPVTILDASRIEQETMPLSSDTRMTVPAPEAPAAIFIHPLAGGETQGVPVLHTMVSHSMIVRLCSFSAIATMDVGETLLLENPQAARAGLFSLWGALLHGASIVLSPNPTPQPAQLAASVRRYDVSLLSLSARRVLACIESAAEVFARLRTLVIERSPEDSAFALRLGIQWLQRNCPSLGIVTVFVSDQMAGYAAAYRAAAEASVALPLPIGFPLEGCQVHLLDADAQPVRAGEFGELAFSGDCVGRPATAVLSDSTAYTQLRMTGLRARQMEDGMLTPEASESPAKPGALASAMEIESLLAAQTELREAAVLSGVDIDGNARLIAFIALGFESGTTAQQLEEQLRRMLDSAIPHSLRFLDALPRDARGNVDRAALQSRWAAETTRQKERTRLIPKQRSVQSAPLQQDTLEHIRALWQRMLHRNFVGYDEDFFDAGGTRVEVIRMHAELNRRFPGAINMGQMSTLNTMRKLHEHLMDWEWERNAGKLEKRGA